MLNIRPVMNRANLKMLHTGPADIIFYAGDRNMECI